jgi:hypothetical protein
MASGRHCRPDGDNGTSRLVAASGRGQLVRLAAKSLVMSGEVAKTAVGTQ